MDPAHFVLCYCDFTTLKSGFMVFIIRLDSVACCYLWVQQHDGDLIKKAVITPNKEINKYINNLEKQVIGRSLTHLEVEVGHEMLNRVP